jgi:hypothetical protein
MAEELAASVASLFHVHAMLREDFARSRFGKFHDFRPFLAGVVAVAQVA